MELFLLLNRTHCVSVLLLLKFWQLSPLFKCIFGGFFKCIFYGSPPPPSVWSTAQTILTKLEGGDPDLQFLLWCCQTNTGTCEPSNFISWNKSWKWSNISSWETSEWHGALIADTLFLGDISTYLYKHVTKDKQTYWIQYQNRSQTYNIMTCF